MAINSYDDNKIMKEGIWVTIMKASCIMSFKPRGGGGGGHFHGKVIGMLVVFFRV